MQETQNKRLNIKEIGILSRWKQKPVIGIPIPDKVEFKIKDINDKTFLMLKSTILTQITQQL